MLALSPSPFAVRAHAQSCSLHRTGNTVVCVHSRAARVSTLQGCKQQAIDRWTRQMVHGSKADLENQIEAKQQILDRVLEQIAAHQQTWSGMQDVTYHSRDQQLWDRQLGLLDRMQQHWEQERQVWLNKEAIWHEREATLLRELATLRSEFQTLLTSRAAAAAGPTAAANYPAAAAGSSSSSRPGVSDLPGTAVISGPSPASAAVADAIRAVRDAHVNPPRDSSSSSSVHGGSSSSSNAGADTWQDLFPGSIPSSRSSSSSTALDSVTAAIAAVDDGADVLADMDLSYSSSSSSSRRERKVDPAADSSNGNGPNPNSSSAAAQATPSSSSSSMPVETMKGDPSGPPPLLSVGDDDIYWVSKLHDGLMSAGFYPSDDEVENWMFAEGTQSALMTYQACNGVPETGTTCEATWRKLLGDEAYERTYGSSSSSSTVAPSTAASGSSSSSSNDPVVVQEEAETVTFSFSGSNSSSSSSGSSSAVKASGSSSSSSGGWPVLMDMDGGREVHALQVSLVKAGYFCGDDEMRWWQFGSATTDALKTFQACNGLPESGVCDERTWKALLGADATPADVEAIRGDESMYEDDMSAPHEGAVWLLGEQRWSRPDDN